MRVPSCILCVIALACVGCSASVPPADAGFDATGDTPSPSTDSETDAGTRDVPSDTATRDVQPMYTLCPESVPSAGTPCSRQGFVCAYGNDPRPECRVRAECVGFMWTVTTPRCTPYDPSLCPASRPANNTPCTPEGQFCTYNTPEGRYHCQCRQCVGGPCRPEPQWSCFQQIETTCPDDPPRLGQPCPEAGRDCRYGICGEGMHVRCSPENMWVSVNDPCPL